MTKLGFLADVFLCLMFSIIIMAMMSCSHWAPVKNCLYTTDIKTEEKTDRFLCETNWFWE